MHCTVLGTCKLCHTKPSPCPSANAQMSMLSAETSTPQLCPPKRKKKVTTANASQALSWHLSTDLPDVLFPCLLFVGLAGAYLAADLVSDPWLPSLGLAALNTVSFLRCFSTLLLSSFFFFFPFSHLLIRYRLLGDADIVSPRIAFRFLLPPPSIFVAPAPSFATDGPAGWTFGF